MSIPSDVTKLAINHVELESTRACGPQNINLIHQKFPPEKSEYDTSPITAALSDNRDVDSIGNRDRSGRTYENIYNNTAKTDRTLNANVGSAILTTKSTLTYHKNLPTPENENVGADKHEKDVSSIPKKDDPKNSSDPRSNKQHLTNNELLFRRIVNIFNKSYLWTTLKYRTGRNRKGRNLFRKKYRNGYSENLLGGEVNEVYRSDSFKFERFPKGYSGPGTGGSGETVGALSTAFHKVSVEISFELSRALC